MERIVAVGRRMTVEKVVGVEEGAIDGVVKTLLAKVVVAIRDVIVM